MHPLTASDPGAPTVLHVTHQLLPDQVGRTIVENCQRLRREGWGAVVASAGGPLADDLRRLGVEHVAMRVEPAGPFGAWRLAGGLAKLCRRRDVGIVHAHRHAGAAAAARVARETGAAFIGTVHDLSDVGARRGEAPALIGGTRVIAVSEHVADMLASHHGTDRDHIRVVPPAVDLQELDPLRIPGPRVFALAEQWGIAPERRVVLVPGPMTREQGHLVLLKALAKLSREDFVLLFLGADAAPVGYRRQIEALVRAGSWQDRVRLAGVCPDVPATLQLADVLALPAQVALPSARSVAQAQAMGRPVIVSGLGALSEAMMPAGTGWVVRPDDVDELAWAIDRALSLDDESRERIAVRARGFAAAEFGLEAVGRKLIGAYRSLLDQHGAA